MRSKYWFGKTLHRSLQTRELRQFAEWGHCPSPFRHPIVELICSCGSDPIRAWEGKDGFTDLTMLVSDHWIGRSSQLLDTAPARSRRADDHNSVELCAALRLMGRPGGHVSHWLGICAPEELAPTGKWRLAPSRGFVLACLCAVNQLSQTWNFPEGRLAELPVMPKRAGVQPNRGGI